MQAIFKLLAIGFPAGYRFTAVNLVAFLCATSVSDYFAQSFFMISLLATFSGFAVSSQSYVVSRNISLVRRFVLVIIFLFLASAPCFFIWEGEAAGYYVAVFAALGYSIFEVVRSDMAVKSAFGALVCQGFLSMCLLGGIVIFWRDAPYILVVFVFWVLAGTAVLFGNQKLSGGDPMSATVIKDVASYSFSNACSSGVMFLIPMLLAKELGEGSITDLAMIVSLSSIFHLAPRYLSAGFMIELQERQSWEMVNRFEKILLLYILFVSALFVASGYIYFPHISYYLMFFLGIIFSQMALPYANVHTVLGLGGRMLKVNMMSTFIFILVSALSYLFVEYGESRATLIMYFYFIYICCRVFITRVSCQNVLAKYN